jgi:anaerobic selenocysteine-containing dehydrogenase
MPLLSAVARIDRRWPRLRLFPLAFRAALSRRPALAPFASMMLYDTLGRALPDGAQSAAVLWFAAHQYAGKHGEAVRRAGLAGGGADLGEALFGRILASPSGAIISEHAYEDTWRILRHRDGRIRLDVPEMLEALRDLAREPVGDREDAYPFVLAAGERRSYNANSICRDPLWRKDDPDGALRIHPEDATRLGLEDGALALCESRRGVIRVRVRHTDTLQPGLVTLPHGYGMDYPDDAGARKENGPRVNLLTAADHRDPITATPYHKHVRVRLRPVPAEVAPPV